MSEWLNALTRALKDEADEVPPGWKTRNQVAEEMGLGVSQADRTLRMLLRNGHAERRMFRIVAAGCVKPIPHFRLKKA